MSMSMSDPHQPLRDDVRLLGELLGATLRAHEGEALFTRVEAVRAMAKAARGGADRAFDTLTDVLDGMPIEDTVPIARAFAHFLALANVAEQHHRTRRRREHARDGGDAPQRGSCAETFARLIGAGIGRTALAEAVADLRVELVLTAHPTEIVRRTLIHKYNRVATILARRDRPDLTPAERDETLDALRREIAGAWLTDESREQRVAVLDEVRSGLIVFEESVWDALPAYLRALDRALRRDTGRALPLTATPITFGSWIGGDRDGNPNVTPEVTRQATWLARWQAADLYLREIAALRDELSIAAATPDLVARADGAREPYRAILREVHHRLVATRALAETHVGRPEGLHDVGEGTDVVPTFRSAAYLSADDFAEPLWLCYRSLVESGNDLIADGRLADVLRRVATFGLVLARLDLRQDSARHTEAIDWIFTTRGVDLTSASEDHRQRALIDALTTEVGSIRDLPLDAASEAVRDVIDTFRGAASVHPESLGAYVITMTRRASDILSVEFLQRLAGNPHPQRVVPLFETADDLAGAGDVLRTLFAIPWYRDRIGGKQEVMVGYSDSAKDAGRFSAAWALYRAQETIARVAADHHIALTLFHGRGGSVGRGGGPTYVAIQSQPPRSVNGTLRVTEQGEMIQAKFGLPDIAERTLEVYTTATLEATLVPPAAPQPAWRACMDRLYEDGRAGYRAIVLDHPRFVEYFRTATPEPELRTINIGSRPATRPSAGGGVESLRAIPWQFAWTQTRLLLASWLGVESALGAALARGETPLLTEMYDEWPFFRSTIDLIEMVLAKSDGRIAALYDRELVAADLQPFGAGLRANLNAAIAAILRITRHRDLVDHNPVLRRSIDVRNPYVDPINLVQIELLRRMRRGGDDDERIHHAFVVTVNGIAAGLRNTG
jgi:phosphoenolpyruvate carboxylase